MDITGKIEKIGNEQQVSASFKKRELVVRTEEQYPQPLMIEFTQDKTSLLDSYKLGDRVTVSINIRGREWTSPQGETKYFISLQGWRINAGEAQPQANAPAPQPTRTAPAANTTFDAPAASDFSLDPQDDDLPF
jgi:single-stranded DNA-binding protein